MKDVLFLHLDGVPDRRGDTFEGATFELRDGAMVYEEFSFKTETVRGLVQAIRQEGTRLVADLAVWRPLRDLKVYPCLSGRILEKDGNHIKRFTVDDIVLSYTPNTDSRIEAVEFVETGAPT